MMADAEQSDVATQSALEVAACVARLIVTCVLKRTHTRSPHRQSQQAGFFWRRSPNLARVATKIATKAFRVAELLAGIAPSPYCTDSPYRYLVAKVPTWTPGLRLVAAAAGGLAPAPRRGAGGAWTLRGRPTPHRGLCRRRTLAIPPGDGQSGGGRQRRGGRRSARLATRPAVVGCRLKMDDEDVRVIVDD